MDYMYVIFRSPVNLFKTVLSILYVLMDGLVVFIMCIVFHSTIVVLRVGRYFDILINSDISNRDYRIEAKNLSDDLSKLSSCSMNIVIWLGNTYITCRILKK